MVAGELTEGIDELEWWMIRCDEISKEVATDGINNSERWGNVL